MLLLECEYVVKFVLFFFCNSIFEAAGNVALMHLLGYQRLL